MSERYAIGADHRGYAHKEYIKKILNEVHWIDVGAFAATPSDYPLFAQKVVDEVIHATVKAGILLCGTGIGMSIAANRHTGIYAALVWNATVAQKAKQHENANIIVLPADYIKKPETVSLIRTWIETPFLNGRYARRCALIDKMQKTKEG